MTFKYDKCDYNSRKNLIDNDECYCSCKIFMIENTGDRLPIELVITKNNIYIFS